MYINIYLLELINYFSRGGMISNFYFYLVHIEPQLLFFCIVIKIKINYTEKIEYWTFTVILYQWAKRGAL